jgi:hypothetical protein
LISIINSSKKAKEEINNIVKINKSIIVPKKYY